MRVSYQYRAKLLRAVDGDTLDAEVQLGFHITAKLRFRLLDIDTPERGEDNFDAATEELERLLALQTDAYGYFVLRSVKTGKYGRWLADIPGVNSELAKRWPMKP